MRDRRDLVQATIPAALLSPLLAHPEFQRGLADANAQFADDYEPAPLSEEQMIEQVELNISRRVTEGTRRLDRFMGWEPSSYFYNLGFVFGTIDKGLTYAPELQQLASLAQAGAPVERQESKQPEKVA